MQTLKDRLDAFLSYKELSQAKFADIVGLSTGFANNVGDSISTKSLNKIIKAFPDLNPLWLTEGEGEMIASKEDSGEKATTTLLLPVSAQGGTLNDFVVSVKGSDCETIISPIKDIDFAIPIAGDSMAPEYPSGSQVLIKKINEKAFIDWGKVFVLDTCNGIVIKRVFPCEEEGVVKCVSINPDYPPFKVSLQDVYGIYRVLMCMSLK